MRNELDYLLCETFPNLYKDRNAPMSQTSMCWGFPGDGWFSLIWEASQTIETELLTMPENERPCARQVKEKFGTLRFYMSGGNEIINDAVRRAENRSCFECEDCGMEGRSRRDSYVRTLCNKCAQVDLDAPLFHGTVVDAEVEDGGLLVFKFQHQGPKTFAVSDEVREKFQ